MHKDKMIFIRRTLLCNESRKSYASKTSAHDYNTVVAVCNVHTQQQQQSAAVPTHLEENISIWVAPQTWCCACASIAPIRLANMPSMCTKSWTVSWYLEISMTHRPIEHLGMCHIAGGLTHTAGNTHWKLGPLTAYYEQWLGQYSYILPAVHRPYSVLMVQ